MEINMKDIQNNLKNIWSLTHGKRLARYASQIWLAYYEPFKVSPEERYVAREYLRARGYEVVIEGDEVSLQPAR